MISKGTNNSIWFSGICDDLYTKIAIWDNAYWQGDVHSTREWLDPMQAKPVPKPVKMAHTIPFREIELQHLIRIVDAIRPGSALLEELRSVQKLWKYGKAVKGYTFNRGYWSHVPLPIGLHRAVIVVFYPEHVKELLDILTEAKTGQKAATVDMTIEQKKKEGKDLFE